MSILVGEAGSVGGKEVRIVEEGMYYQVKELDVHVYSTPLSEAVLIMGRTWKSHTIPRAEDGPRGDASDPPYYLSISA